VSGKVPVLLGFDLDRSTDRNLERIQVRLIVSNNTLYFTHVFEDENANSDDPYCFRVDYAWVPAGRVIAQYHYADPSEHRGSHEGSLSTLNNRPVLQGFQLRFTNGDHHVDQVGVRLLPGDFKIWFNDQNDDDPFRWEIWWASLL
jgi:hypothetical protein